MCFSGVPCQVCRYTVPGDLSQSISMWVLEMTTSADSSASRAAGLPNGTVSTSAGKANWCSGSASQRCSTASPRMAKAS